MGGSECKGFLPHRGKRKTKQKEITKTKTKNKLEENNIQTQKGKNIRTKY